LLRKCTRTEEKSALTPRVLGGGRLTVTPAAGSGGGGGGGHIEVFEVF
jgi:hypothetical protein